MFQQLQLSSLRYVLISMRRNNFLFNTEKGFRQTGFCIVHVEQLMLAVMFVD